MKLNFEQITLTRRHEYQQILSACPQVASDYSFVNLWAWSGVHGLEWAFSEDGLVWIRQSRPGREYWAPMGPWDRVDWERSLAGLTGQIVFQRVPEILCDHLKSVSGVSFTRVETREHWDYLYGYEDLAVLPGNRYHKKKNLVNQFIKKYDYTYRQLGTDSVNQALALQADWCTWRDCESSEALAAENQVIAKVFTGWSGLDVLKGGALWADETMVAYTVAEVMDTDTLLIHFEKGHPDYKGVYQAINRIFLAEEQFSCRFVNREQDLGDPGLRKAKESYHPVDYIRKYGVILERV